MNSILPRRSWRRRWISTTWSCVGRIRLRSNSFRFRPARPRASARDSGMAASPWELLARTLAPPSNQRVSRLGRTLAYLPCGRRRTSVSTWRLCGFACSFRKISRKAAKNAKKIQTIPLVPKLRLGNALASEAPLRKPVGSAIEWVHLTHDPHTAGESGIEPQRHGEHRGVLPIGSQVAFAMLLGSASHSRRVSTWRLCGFACSFRKDLTQSRKERKEDPNHSARSQAPAWERTCLARRS